MHVHFAYILSWVIGSCNNFHWILVIYLDCWKLKSILVIWTEGHKEGCTVDLVVYVLLNKWFVVWFGLKDKIWELTVINGKRVKIWDFFFCEMFMPSWFC